MQDDLNFESVRRWLARSGDQAGNAFVSLLLALPFLVTLVFVGYWYGIETAIVPIVNVNVQAFLNSPFNNSYFVTQDGIKIDSDAVTANVDRLLVQASGLAGSGGYSFGVVAAAFRYRCDGTIPSGDLVTGNPLLIVGKKLEQTESMDQNSELDSLADACTAEMTDMPPGSCSPKQNPDEYIGYGVSIKLRIDATHLVEAGRCTIVFPGGPCTKSTGAGDMLPLPEILLNPTASTTPTPTPAPNPTPTPTPDPCAAGETFCTGPDRCCLSASCSGLCILVGS